MRTVLDIGRGPAALEWFGPEAREGGGPPVHGLDRADISDEAMRRYEQSGLKPPLRRAPSLTVLQSRIGAIREEIARIWNSPLPDKDKYIQISARETEISLLEAGIFEFARAGFDVSI